MMQLQTEFTQMLKIRYPIIGAPMFLVSNIEMVVAISEAGGIGTFPALNFRTIQEYRQALQEIRQRTRQPIGVNIIVNKTNVRQKDDLKYALENGVELLITSLGSPQEVIRLAHQNGTKVFCDVTNLQHALKVQDMGADGVIAVASGAGGHAGSISSMVLIPWLKTKLQIPIVAAGGIAKGQNLAAALALGASAVSVGTRFIASSEAKVDLAYKQAILQSSPEDIVLSTRISGTPAAVINTPYVQKMGLALPFYLQVLKNSRWGKKLIMPLIHYAGMKTLEKSAKSPTWKSVWSAGQCVGLIDEVLSSSQIIEQFIEEYQAALQQLPQLQKL